MENREKIKAAERATRAFVRALEGLDCGHWVYTNGTRLSACREVVAAREAAIAAWMAAGKSEQKARTIVGRALSDNKYCADYTQTHDFALRMVKLASE